MPVNILYFLLYIIIALLLLLLFLVAFVLLVPFRYRFEGGYESKPSLCFNVRCSPAFIFSGTWEDGSLKSKFRLFGIPLNIDPQKFKKKAKKEEEITKAKDKKKKGSAMISSILDKEFRRRGMALVRDLVKILKPEELLLKGRIGFAEPHLTGLLAAAVYSLKYCCNQCELDLEPVWEDEYYAFEARLAGKICVGLILVKVGWFFMVSWFRNAFSKSFRGEQAATIS
jgi:hypothetical protein